MLQNRVLYRFMCFLCHRLVLDCRRVSFVRWLRRVLRLERSIKEKLQDLNHTQVEIITESHMHSGPATDSHFKLVAVSTEFENVRAVARHQRLYKMFSEELQGQVHALSLFLYTPEEWQQAEVPSSPNCRGLGQ